MIKSIVFDMGKVIQDFDPIHAVAPFASDPSTRALLIDVIFKSPEWLELDRGTIDYALAEESWCKRLPDKLHATLHEIVISWHKFMPYYPETVTLIKRLKQNGYGLYLLSNASKRFYAYQNACEAFGLMDGIIISADFNILKPEPGIYGLLLKKFNLSPHECYFIDDRPENTLAAQRLGFVTYTYSNDPENLINDLRLHGVNI